MWINDKVIYTPEIVTITKGESVEAIVEGISVNADTITIRFPNGTQENVESRLCQITPQI